MKHYINERKFPRIPKVKGDKQAIKDHNHIQLLECERLSFAFGDSWVEIGHLAGDYFEPLVIV